MAICWGATVAGVLNKLPTLKAAQAAVHGAGGDVTALADANPHGTDTVHGATLEVEVPAARLDDTPSHSPGR